MEGLSTVKQRKVLFEKEHLPVYKEGSVNSSLLEMSRKMFLPESGYERIISVNATSGRETIWQGFQDGLYKKADSTLMSDGPCLTPRLGRRIVTGEQVSDAKLCQMFCLVRNFDERLMDQGQINNFVKQYSDEIRRVGAVVFPTFSGQNIDDVFFVGVVSTEGLLEAKKFRFFDKRIFPAQTWKIVLLHC